MDRFDEVSDEWCFLDAEEEVLVLSLGVLVGVVRKLFVVAIGEKKKVNSGERERGGRGWLLNLNLKIAD